MSASTKMFCLYNSTRNLLPKVVGLTPRTRSYPFRRMSSYNVVQYLDRVDGNKIAYKVVAGTETSINHPGIVFCPGFQSNMDGVKAMALEKYCLKKGLSYARFDYLGCGESSGDLRQATLSDWKQDVLHVIDELTAGPQIIVGSSIGGWLMLLAALERPHRIHSLVGIATAVDFPERGFASYPPEVQKAIQEKGEAVYTRDHMTYVLTKKFLEDSKKHNLLNQDIIPVTCPVRFLHGMDDQLVPYQVSLKVAEKIWAKDVNVTLTKVSDHRFSQTEDIQLLFEMLDYLIYGAEQAQELAISSWKAFSVYNKPDGDVHSKSKL